MIRSCSWFVYRFPGLSDNVADCMHIIYIIIMASLGTWLVGYLGVGVLFLWCICLFACLSVSESACGYVRVIIVPVCLSVCLPVCLCPKPPLCFCALDCLNAVHGSIDFSVLILSVCLFVCVYLCMYVCPNLPVCTLMYAFLCVCQHACLSVRPSDSESVH